MRGKLAAIVACLALAACNNSARVSQTAPATRAASTTTTTTMPKRHIVRHVVRPVGTVTAIGDSTMIDAAPALRAAIPRVAINAAVSRSALPGPPILFLLAAARELGSEVVFALGTNGGLSASLIDQVVQVAAGRRIVMVTNHCNCGVAAPNNMIIRAGCTAARHCVVADWNALANAHPAWLTPDGVHMPIGGTGAVAYARLIRSKL
jgi:hypothetical protein